MPYDYLIRALGRSSFLNDSAKRMPFIKNEFSELLISRALLLNCLTQNYAQLWSKCYKDSYADQEWLKQDNRLSNDVFALLSQEWNFATPVRDDYARRQAMIEIDVIVAISLGLSLNQLKAIYHIQFPVLEKYEADTWYDANGRIVFTNNRSLVGVGFDRKEWENELKDAPAGKKFYRTITDDTMPGGPVERTIEYVAPFDRCNREKDYETAWKFFEKKYGKD